MGYEWCDVSDFLKIMTWDFGCDSLEIGIMSGPPFLPPCNSPPQVPFYQSSTFSFPGSVHAFNSLPCIGLFWRRDRKHFQKQWQLVDVELLYIIGSFKCLVNYFHNEFQNNRVKWKSCVLCIFSLNSASKKDLASF